MKGTILLRLFEHSEWLRESSHHCTFVTFAAKFSYAKSHNFVTWFDPN